MKNNIIHISTLYFPTPMIIKTISHDYKDYEKEVKGNLSKKNFTGNHQKQPFLYEREYIRALNATKIERMLAKPFIKGFSDHKEGISTLALHKNQSLAATLSFDGEVFFYNLEKKQRINKKISMKQAKGIAFSESNFLVGCIDRIHVYDNDQKEINNFSVMGTINHLNCQNESFFASTNNGSFVYDLNKETCKAEYFKNNICKFGVFSEDLIGVCSEGKIGLIDHRAEKEFYYEQIGLKTNCVAFDVNSSYFATANDDHNGYMHDLRFLKRPIGILRGHVRAVLSVDYNKEIVTGSLDNTVRIFKADKQCRDVYYNKRMHAINSLYLDGTGKMILTGSDDGSLRIWRKDASVRMDMTKYENENLSYVNMLKNKYAEMPEIKRISKHRFLPAKLKYEIKNKYEHYKAVERRKKSNND